MNILNTGYSLDIVLDFATYFVTHNNGKHDVNWYFQQYLQKNSGIRNGRINYIIYEITRFTGIKRKDILSGKRGNQDETTAKQLLSFFLAKEGMSPAQIGLTLGVPRLTIYARIRKAGDLLFCDKKFIKLIEKIENELY